MWMGEEVDGYFSSKIYEHKKDPKKLLATLVFGDKTEP